MLYVANIRIQPLHNICIIRNPKRKLEKYHCREEKIIRKRGDLHIDARTHIYEVKMSEYQCQGVRTSSKPKLENQRGIT